jgi:hypothetical protein
LSMNLGRGLNQKLKSLDDLYWKNFAEKPAVAEEIYRIWESGFEIGFVNGVIELVEEYDAEGTSASSNDPVDIE